MSKLRNAVEKLPHLVGSTEVHAKRWAKSLLNIFVEELTDPKSVFAAEVGESVHDRLAILRSLYMLPGADWRKVGHVYNLFAIYALSCAIFEGATELEEERDVLAASAAVEELNHPEIKAVLSVETAVKASKWE